MSHKFSLSETQVADLREAFTLFDLDGNGTISPSELENIMHSTLGAACPAPNKIRAIVQSVDTDHSGSIDFEEFLTFMSDQELQNADKDEMREAFDMFDKDGNGYISMSELKTVMRNLGERLRDDEIEEILKEADSDGDRNISYSEFKEMVRA